MPIIVTCDECSKTHRVKDSAAGKVITCLGCGRKLRVVSPDALRTSDRNADTNDADSGDRLTRDDVRELARQVAATESSVTPVEPLPPFPKRLAGFVVSVLLLGLVGYFATVVSGSFREAWRSNSWPSVMGTVKSSTTQHTGVGKNARTFAVVGYHYEVGAVQHKGYRICVEGYSKKIFESAKAVSDRYVVGQPVKVFYDPQNHASAVLETGTTPTLWGPMIMLALLGSSVGYGTYASFRSLIGKPLPKRAQTGRSLLERVMAFFAFSMIVLLVGTMVFVILSTRQNWHLPSGLGEWFMLFFILFLSAVFLGIASLAGLGMYCSFMPAAKESELQADPSAPRFSDDSLVCITGIAKHFSAVIVDDKAGMIHFRRTFRPPGFWTIRAVPWFSCPLKSITSVSEMSYKGTTTLTFHSKSGKGSVTSHASRFDELRQRFSKTNTEYAPGTAPLSGMQAVMIAIGFIGIFAGMVLTISSVALGVVVAVVSIVLLVSSVFVAAEKN